MTRLLFGARPDLWIVLAVVAVALGVVVVVVDCVVEEVWRR